MLGHKLSDLVLVGPCSWDAWHRKTKRNHSEAHKRSHWFKAAVPGRAGLLHSLVCFSIKSSSRLQLENLGRISFRNDWLCPRNLQENELLLSWWAPWVKKREISSRGNAEPGRRIWVWWTGPGASSQSVQVPHLSLTYYMTVGQTFTLLLWVSVSFFFISLF